MPPTTKRKRRKRLLFSLAALLLIAAGLVIIPSTSPFERYVLRRLKTYIKNKHGLLLDARRLDLRVWGLSASLRDFKIRPLQEDFGILKAFSAEEITAHIAFSMLFSRKLHLDEIKIRTPRLEIYGPDKTRSPAQTRFTAGKAGARKPFSLRIERLDLKDGAIVFQENRLPIEASLSGVAADLHYEQTAGEHRGSFQAREGGIVFRGERISLKEAILRFRFDDRKLTLENLLLRTPLSGIEVEGEVLDYLIKPAFSFHVRGAMAIEELPLPDSSLRGSGKVAFSAKLEGRDSRLAYSGEIRGDDLSVSDIPVGNMTIAFAGKDKDLDLSKAVLQLPAGTLEGNGKLSFAGEPNYLLNLRWNDLDLSKVTGALPDFPIIVLSKTTGTLEARGHGLDPKNLAASAAISLLPIEASSTGTGKRRLLAGGNLKLRLTDGILFLDRSVLSSGGADLTLQGHFDRTGRFSYKYALNISDLGATALFLASLADPGSLPKQAVDILPTLRGRFALSGTLGGTMNAPAGSLEIEAREVGIKGFPVRSLKASLKATPERLDLSSFRMEAAEGTIEADGSASLDIKQKRFGRNLLLQVRIKDIGLSSFASFIPQELRKMEQAKISGTVGVKGGISTPEAGFRIEVAPLFSGLGGQARFAAAGRLEGRRLVLENMRMEGSGITLSANMDIDLSRRTFAAAMRGDGINLSGFRSLLPPEMPLEGIFSLEAEGKGNFQNPEFKAKISGRNFRVSGIEIPSLDFTANSDGRQAKASLDLSALNLRMDTSVLLESPYRITGKVTIPVLPLARLAGKKTVGETSLFKAGTVEATFSFPLLKKEDFGAEVTFSGIDIGALAKLSPQAARFPLRGEAAGKVRIRGNPAEPAGMKMEGEINRLALDSSEIAIENKTPIRFRFLEDMFFLDELRLAGNNAQLSLSGQAGPLSGLLSAPKNQRPAANRGEPAIKVRLSTDLDLSALSPFFPDVVPGGRFKLDIDAAGPLSKPRISGSGDLQNGFLQLRIFPLRITDVSGQIIIQDSRATLSGFKGRANGGFFNLSGEISNIALTALPSASLKASIMNFNLNYPEGFLSTSDADLVLQGDGKEWLISGEVRLRSGYFKEDIYPGAEMLGFSKFRPRGGPEGLPPIFQNVRLDIRASATEPFIIKNNLADMELGGDLKVHGTLAVPLLSGRIRNVHAGEIVFSDRRYAVETAGLNFLGKEVREPDLDLVAHTKLTHDLEELDIRLRLSGPISKLTYDLTSIPPRSREELSLLLLTGKSLDQISGSAVNTLSSQMILYFASPLASPITQGLKKLLKAEDVVIEPLNIASEADPGARFTFKKRVSGQAAVTYSLDISNSQRQTWLLDYNLIRGFALRAFSKDTGNYGASFSHSFSLGFPRRPAAAESPEGRLLTVREVDLWGDLQFPQKILMKEVRTLRRGARFKFAELQTAADNLLRFYRKKGYASAIVTPEVDEKNGRDAVIVLRIAAGRPSRFLFQGDSIPASVRKKVRETWDGKLPEETNLQETANIILQALRWKGRFKADVKTEKKTGAAGDEFMIRVKKGERYRIRGVAVEGNEKLAKSLILKSLKDYPGAGKKNLWNLLLDTRLALKSLKKTYEEHGFLKAEIDAPHVREDARELTLDITLRIREGPQCFVAGVAFKGNTRIGDKDLSRGLRLIPGSIYNPSLVLEDRNSLLSMYRIRGFQDAEVSVLAFPAEDEKKINLLYEIREGEAHTIAGIEIAGNSLTRESFIRREAGLAGGSVVNLQILAKAQKRLYDTGIFRSVTLETAPTAASGGNRRLLVRVEETPRFSMTYGLRYNSEEKVEGSEEMHLNNLFGAGGNSILSYRQNKRQKDLRFSLRQPYLFGARLNSLYSFYFTEDIRESFVTKEIGFSVQQEAALPLGFNLSFLYRLNRIHSYSPKFSGPFAPDFSLLLSETMLSLIRDSRDDKMDPRRGSFFSLALTYAPRFLGSELTYIRGFAQAAFYKTVLPGLVWASSYRLGLADAFDQVLVSSRRFFAGGGNSIRGFKLDRVGPIDPYLDRPEGGEAVLIMNQELRFSIFKKIRGAVFYDMGNIFPYVRDFRLSDVRHGMGLGLRFESPVGLIRADYGFNISPRPAESRGAFYLSIGQAF